MFTRAIEIDPDFAQAHAYLALFLVEVFWTEIWSEEKAKATLEPALLEAQRAVALDGNDSRCHSALGWVHVARKSFDLAAHHIDLAIKLNPNFAENIVCGG